MFEHVEKLHAISADAKASALEILQKLDPSVANDWLSKIKVIDGRAAGTRYEEISHLLSYHDFVKLYEAIGYTFQPQNWINYWCGPSEINVITCRPDVGFTCDPQHCGEQ